MTRPPKSVRGDSHRGDRPGRGRTRVTRGQSTALDYTLALGVAALVVTGLFAAAGDFVTDRRGDVVRTELEVVGEQLTDKLLAADRLVQAGNRTDRLVMNASMPRRVAGASYTVSVTQAGSSHWLNLTSNGIDASVAIKLDTRTDLATGSTDGGDVAIVYDPDDDQLEVR